MNDMKKGTSNVEVGVYELGYDNIRLIISSGRSGKFSLNPNKTIPCIIVGGEYVKWEDFYAVVLHEALEFALTRGNCRYINTQDLSCDSGAYVFACTHSQFSDCCAKAAEFLATSHKDLRLAWLRFKIEHKIKDTEKYEEIK